MTERTCSVGGCRKRHFAQGLCNMHYLRKRAGKPLHRTCATCGASLEGRGGNVAYCGADCKPRCAVPSCGKARRKQRWCERHYSRMRDRGSVEDLDQAWTWAKPGTPCRTCGVEFSPKGGLRAYCSTSCASYYSLHGARPKVKTCRVCGCSFSLNERSASGRRRYASKTVCDGCAKRKSLRKHVAELVARDGDACTICGEVVDIVIPHPNRMSPSVDHVLPRSLGGPDDLTNYALTHLICNIRKQNRVGEYLNRDKG